MPPQPNSNGIGESFWNLFVNSATSVGEGFVSDGVVPLMSPCFANSSIKNHDDRFNRKMFAGGF